MNSFSLFQILSDVIELDANLPTFCNMGKLEQMLRTSGKVLVCFKDISQI